MATPTYPTLGPEDLQFFASGKRRLRQTHDLGRARNVYERGVAETQGGRRLEDLTRQFTQMRERIPGAHAGRGTLNSGIYQGDLADYGRDFTREIGRARQDQSSALGGFDLANQQLGDVYQSAVFDLEEQQKARRQAIAAALRHVR